MVTEIALNNWNVSTILSTIRHVLQIINSKFVTSIDAAQKERILTDAVHNDSDSADNVYDGVVEDHIVSTSDYPQNDSIVRISEPVREQAECSVHEDNVESCVRVDLNV